MPSRREVLSMIAALAAMALPGSLRAGDPVGKQRRVHLFSKHLQWLDYDRMAETAAAVGFDGVDLTVRPKGHVLPEHVERDLPRAVTAIRHAGLIADRITTAITDPRDPLSERVLATAAELDIRICRLGWLKYDRSRPLPPQIESYRRRFEDLAALSERFGIHGAYQNHAGTGVGSPVWDAWLLVKDLDPRWLGIRYDVRHAVAEGSQSWELGLQLLASRIRSLDVKDFIWRNEDGDWGIQSVPLGTGAVDFERFFTLLDQWRVEADITLHLEYPLGGAEKGRSRLSVPAETVIEAMSDDLSFLRDFG